MPLPVTGVKVALVILIALFPGLGLAALGDPCRDIVFEILNAHHQWSETYILDLQNGPGGVTVEFLDRELNTYRALVDIDPADCQGMDERDWGQVVRAHQVKLIERNCVSLNGDPLGLKAGVYNRLKGHVPLKQPIYDTSATVKSFRRLAPSDAAIRAHCIQIEGIVRADLVIDGASGRVEGLIGLETANQPSLQDFTNLVRLLREVRFEIVPARNVETTLVFDFKAQ